MLISEMFPDADMAAAQHDKAANQGKTKAYADMGKDKLQGGNQPTPITTAVNDAAIPAVLKSKPNWVLWKPEWKPDNGKWGKIPKQVNGKGASTIDPGTWNDFETILAASREAGAVAGTDMGAGRGIGFVLTKELMITGIDLDSCRDADTGQAEPWAQQIIDDINSYTEVSPSGTGYRILVLGTFPPDWVEAGIDGKNSNGVEIYQAGRYLTITGQHIDTTPVALKTRQDELASFCHTQFPDAVTGAQERTEAADDGTEATRPLTDEMRRALHAHRNYSATWNRARDFEDQSASTYDLALANIALSANWPGWAVRKLIFEWREIHGENPGKINKDSYWQRTIGMARAGKHNHKGNGTVPPGTGPWVAREGFEERAKQASEEKQKSEAEAARSAILDASLGNPARLAELESRLANTKWFMPGLVAYGEITHFYGPPGSGKTLLWMHLLHKLTPEQRGEVIFLNFDDSPHGAVQKMKLLPGIEMINKGEAPTWLTQLAWSGDWVKGKVIILDTMKKFANVIHKESVKGFFTVLRRLVNEGATVVSLGHTNKHLNDAGQYEFEGVGDVKADCDGLILVQRSIDPISGESTIILTPDENKARAGQHEQAYRFAARDNETEYAALVVSGMPLTREQLEREKANLREQELREQYADEIDLVEYFLRKNPAAIQSKIIEYHHTNSKNYGFGRPRLTDALKAMSGICWTITKGSNNSKIYRLTS